MHKTDCKRKVGLVRGAWGVILAVCFVGFLEVLFVQYQSRKVRKSFALYCGGRSAKRMLVLAWSAN